MRKISIHEYECLHNLEIVEYCTLQMVQSAPNNASVGGEEGLGKL